MLTWDKALATARFLFRTFAKRDFISVNLARAVFCPAV